MGPARTRRLLLASCVAAIVAAIIAACGGSGHTTSADAAERQAEVTALRVGAAPVGPSVPRSFVGLATEYWDVERLIGTNPNNLDVPFERLLGELSPAGSPSLRVGGDSTDWVWWPLKGIKQPPWVHWSLSADWASVVSRFAAASGTKLLLGINLEADSPRVSSAEISELARHVGRSHIADFEIGNEPELYSKYPFYTVGTRAVKGRRQGYAWLGIAPDIASLTAKLPRTGVPFAAPGFAMLNAEPYVGDLLTDARRVSMVTVHTYPLKSPRCNGGHLLAEGQLFTAASLGDLANRVASFVRVAARHGAKVRTDEMNAVTCNGEAGFSNTFGPALWALNVLADYVGTGDSGVNFDFEPISAQHLITAKDTSDGWRVQVLPTYYGLLTFSIAAPAGSRLIPISTPRSGLFDWAARTPAGLTNVVVTNVTDHAMRLRLSVPGVSGVAKLSLLSAHGGLTATSGVTLAGLSISPSTGLLSGDLHQLDVAPSAGRYVVSVPAASAAIVSFR